MKKKRLILLLCFLGLVGILPLRSYAATEIKRVKLKVGIDEYMEDDSYTLDIETKGHFEVSEIESLNTQNFEPSTGPAAQHDIQQSQEQEFLYEKEKANCFELELSAEDGYSFTKMEQKDIKLSGLESICTKAVRKNNGSTLVLSINVPGLDDVVKKVENATLSQNGIATWDRAPGACEYQVTLFKNGKKIGRNHATAGTSYDFSPLLHETGTYSFKVIPFSLTGKKGGLIESSKINVEYSNDMLKELPGWMLDPNRGNWKYYLEDGTYIQHNWLQDVDGRWYYFDENGFIVKEKWICWKKQWYYFDEIGVWIR